MAAAFSVTGAIFSAHPTTPFLQKRHTQGQVHLLPWPLRKTMSFSLIPTFSVARSRGICLNVRAASAATVECDVREKEGLDIAKLGISEEIVSSLSRRGITELFPIQRAVLVPAMDGRDMIGRAITGSGKTLAFGIPILDKIIRHNTHRRQKRVPSALVLAPTRELARQVQKEFKESAPNLISACLYGGIPIMNQVRVLSFGTDIVVGTPGRIIDLIERGALDLSEVKFVVLDEADEMLAVGFQEAVECIMNYLPSKKQCMLFSATMPSWVNELAKKYLRDPLVIDLVGDSEQKLAEGISLYSVASTTYRKQSVLQSLITKFAQGGKSIVFTRTKKDAEVLSRTMGSTLGSRALHGNMQQFQRDRTLAAFRDGHFNVLVATDVAARGLDIPNVDLVIHFEIPNTSEIFVHRSGRTGRAGKKGTAVLIYTEDQRRTVRLIERDVGCKFEELPKIKDVGSIPDNFEESPRGGFVDRVRSRFDRPSNSGVTHFDSYRSSQGSRYDTADETRGRGSRDFDSSRRGQFGGYESYERTPFSSNRGRSHCQPANQRTQFGGSSNFGSKRFTERGKHYSEREGASGSGWASRSFAQANERETSLSDMAFNDAFGHRRQQRRPTFGNDRSDDIEMFDVFGDRSKSKRRQGLRGKSSIDSDLEDW
ncbi:hypothetical protein AMTRI_Chr04g185450 [Amborella trichopoda]|uniref:RNA helicase n=1 Tax=Amborella trichopoda TaxID=13333 RepID=W1NNB9_AMBTC|nr:DEAD-box ATP-dependent RNA helicase 53 [Amborella trichopoda]ERM97148.1 hypothetical protein AMTR_s00126p00110160 [Amborella trichopoda]|eukprot:XP_006829732.1 DEAD-box ATP-dependent RNA helicase 53 [Amborella trichopoda]